MDAPAHTGVTPAADVSRGTVARVLRTPWIHFLLLGGLLFLAVSWRGSLREVGAAGERAPIVFTAADLGELRREWARQHVAPPSLAEEEALIEQAIDREVLHREALEIGFHRDDPVVRRRLVKLGRFLGLAPDGDEEAIEREAQALGLDRTDTVVRRHLVQMMQLAAARPEPSDLPKEAELRRYYDRNVERFLAPAEVHLTHVYLSADRRGGGVERDAAQLLVELRRGVRPEEAPRRGDLFVRGAQVPLASRSQLERIFGPEFAAAIEKVPPRTWTGPVRSSYGIHLVWIHDRLPARIPPLDAVRNQVLHGLLRERSKQRVRTATRALRKRWKIERAPAGLPPRD